MKRNKGLPSKGHYKVKRIMQRHGKRHTQPVMKAVPQHGEMSIGQPGYVASSSLMMPFNFEYTYIPGTSTDPVPEGGIAKGE
jgi:hypothetical protein